MCGNMEFPSVSTGDVQHGVDAVKNGLGVGLIPRLQLLFLLAIPTYLLYRSIKYLAADLPPWGSGLKSLPGPISTLPYVGRAHDVDRNAPWTAMKKFSDMYDGLFSCTLGGETHIWVSREDVAQDLLCNHASISSARADLGAYPDVTKGFKYLPLIGYTHHLVRQRKFAHQIVGQSHRNGFYGYIGLEARRFLFELSRQPDGFADLINLFFARVSSRLAYGDAESAAFHVENAARFIHQLGPSGPVTNLLPFLGWLPEWLVRDIWDVRDRQEKEERMWKGLFNRTRQKEMVGKEGDSPPTYVKTALEMQEGKEGGKLLFENEEEAKFAVGMLCTVAIFTVQGPGVLFVMAMILHPEWQEKVRQEIDEVLGEEELVDLKHSPQLPTLRAAIKECIRWKSTVPLGVPRLLEENYSYNGLHFPKGGVVHVLDIAISQDPNRYIAPEVYNPARWLDPSSPNYKAPLTEHPRLKGHHIFGRGKRMCPGQDIADAELLVMCGNLLRYFVLGPRLDTSGAPIWPDPGKWGNNVIGGPRPFECSIRVRDRGKLEGIERLYRDAFGFWN